MCSRSFLSAVALGGVAILAGCGQPTSGYGSAQQALVTTPTWKPLNLGETAPPARNDHAMAYDPDRGVVVLFGGKTASSGDVELQDTWEWSLGAEMWNEVGPPTCTTATCPPKRSGHTLVYDPGLKAMVLFGGHKFDAWLNDLWLWRGGRWTAVDQSGQTIPDPRHNHTMVHDPVGQGSPLLWMLGGSVNNVTQSDLWVLTLDASGNVPKARWNFVSDGPLPDRYGHAMVYAPGLDAFYVFGGRSFTSGGHNDLWRLSRDLSWSDVSPQVSPSFIAPTARYQVTMAAYGDLLVVFGGTDRNLVDVLGDTWEGGESGWSEITPAGSSPGPRGESAMVATPQGLLLFGGRGYAGGGSKVPLSDTFLYERQGAPPVDGGSGTPDAGTDAGGRGGADGGPDTVLDPVPRYACESSGQGGSRGGFALGLLLGVIGLGACFRSRRPKQATRPLMLLLLLILPAGGARASPSRSAEGPVQRMKLAFLGLSAGQGEEVDLRTDTAALSEFVQSELGALDVYDVMGPEEVRGLLGLEEQRQLLGCTSEDACQVSFAAALEAERVLNGNLGKVGSRFVLNLTLVDLESQRNIARAARHAREVDDLLDLVRGALIELVQKDQAVAARFSQMRPSRPLSPLIETPVEGLMLAPRVDLALLAPKSFGLGLGVGLHLGWRLGRAGVATTLLLKPLGLRMAGRFHPVKLWRFLPYLEAGVALFFDSFSLRTAMGFEVDLRLFRLFFDLAYERGITSWPASSGKPLQPYLPDALLLGGGIGWSF